MLYLIIDAYLDENLEPKKCLKIGYAKNIDDRMMGYGTTNNLNVILLDTREGGYGLEKLLHHRYKDKIIKIKGNREWMDYDEEIVREFKSLTKKELFLNYFPNKKERQLKELVFDYFIGEENEDGLNFLLNRKKCREFSLIKDYLSSPIYFMNDVINLINQLQEEFNIVLNNESKDSFISSFHERFNIKDISELEGVFQADCLVKDEMFEELDILKSIYKSNGIFETKMKSVCDFLLNPKWYGYIHVSDLYWLPLNMRNYIIQLGPEKIRALGYKEALIRREITNQELSGQNDLMVCLIERFIVGNKYSLKSIKEDLLLIYNKVGITKTPKATDLEDYFNIRKCTINLKDGKRINGYEILSLKNP